MKSAFYELATFVEIIKRPGSLFVVGFGLLRSRLVVTDHLFATDDGSPVKCLS